MSGVFNYPQVREILTADRTYYVRTDGSDTNNGLADTAGGAFLTIQKALNVCLTIDLGGFAVTIQVRTGTYTGANTLSTTFLGGVVTVSGDTTTPSNVVISVTSNNCFYVLNGASLKLQGLKVSTTTSGSCLVAEGGGVITITGKMDFGAASAAHCYANYQGSILFGTSTAAIDYNITGSAAFHYIAQYGGFIQASAANTVTITGTPAFSVAFAYASDVSAFRTFSYTFSGSATGKRYDVSGNSSISTIGGGINYFPGNSAGTATTGGQYS